jgi:1-deoxy-D-xylulose-5-phosphate reductoisomerase
VFSCLDLAYQAGRAGDLAPAWLNAANEVAVAAFLGGRIGWSAIAEVVAETLDGYQAPAGEGSQKGANGFPTRTVDDVLETDAAARRTAERVVAARELAA